MKKEHQVCTRCVMDTTDPDIIFDAQGVCSHCHAYDYAVSRFVFQGEDAKARLEKFIDRIRKDGRGSDYDCVLGISGGVDSSYVAMKLKEFGLRPLAVHMDNGWDSEAAVKNIENICNKLNIDLHTHVLNWNEFRDLQLSFLKASTPDSEIPSDHAIWAVKWKVAKKFKIRHLFTGCNRRTETHGPKAWSRGYWDWKYIRSVHEKFGTVKLREYPHFNFIQYHNYVVNINRIDVLNFLDYNKAEAKRIITEKLQWRDYGGKHFESIYTRFYQGWILPNKFGFDKRKSHLSSLICSGQIKRDEALEELKKETYPEEMQRADREYVIKKLEISESEFDEIMALPLKSFADYPSYEHLYSTLPYKFSLESFKWIRSVRKKVLGASLADHVNK